VAATLDARLFAGLTVLLLAATTGCKADPECTDVQSCAALEDPLLDADFTKVDLLSREVEFRRVDGGATWLGCNATLDGVCTPSSLRVSDSKSMWSQNYREEHPQLPITVAPFYMGRFEVTAGQYARCVQAGKCVAAPTGKDVDGYNYVGGDSNKLDHAINGTSWHQAHAYCRFLGGRLPTEAEWEFAARGGCVRLKKSGLDCARAMPTWSFGKEFPQIRADVGTVVPEEFNDYAILASNTAKVNWGSQQVGSKPLGISPWGMHDMTGNVWEWTSTSGDFDHHCKLCPECDSCTKPQNCSCSSVTDPGPEKTTKMTLKGGGFTNSAKDTRVSARMSIGASNNQAIVGFRCAIEIPAGAVAN